MKIGIDCRLWGVKHAGIGRYTENLVKNLAEIDRENEYVLFCRSDNTNLLPRFKKGKTVIADVKHYSLREQLVLPKIFSKEKLELLHVPHFNVPLFYRSKFVVTIHDVLWHQIKGLSVTTLSPLVYGLKYAGYRAVVKSAVRKAARVITPSHYVKDDLVRRFVIKPNKIIVTPEGVTEHGTKNIEQSGILSRYKIYKPYLLYVGSLYPHKNVEFVVKALKELKDPPQFVIVCGRSVFWERFREFVKKERAEGFVNLVGFVPDKELAALYKGAAIFVFPTLSEGFGLPALEAMAAGCPVICSDIPVLHEVYNDAVLYFDPHDVNRITELIQELLQKPKRRREMIKKGKERVKLYSWRKMAQQTLEVYKGVKAE